MRYVRLEGRFKVAYAYPFNLFNHFKFLITDKLNFPFFICNSIEYSIETYKRKIVALPLHESVFYLDYLKDLDNQIKPYV